MRRMPTGKELKALERIKIDEDGELNLLDLEKGIKIPLNENNYFLFNAHEDYPHLHIVGGGVDYAISNWSDGIYISYFDDDSPSDILYISTSTFELCGQNFYLTEPYTNETVGFEPTYAQAASGYNIGLLLAPSVENENTTLILYRYGSEQYPSGGEAYLEIGVDFDRQDSSFNGASVIIKPETNSITLTCAPSGTATLKIHRTSGKYFTASTEIIPDRIGLHMDITTALGTNTSQQITLSHEDEIDLSTLNATGVLLNGTSLVGCCHLVGTSQNQAVLYFQNALGTDLQAGIYTANLTSVLDN